MVELAKFRNPQCAKITSREIFETANREIYQLAKKNMALFFLRTMNHKDMKRLFGKISITMTV